MENRATIEVRPPKAGEVVKRTVPNEELTGRLKQLKEMGYTEVHLGPNRKERRKRAKPVQRAVPATDGHVFADGGQARRERNRAKAARKKRGGR